MVWPLLLGVVAFWPVILRIQTFMPEMPAVMPAAKVTVPVFLLDPMDTSWQNYPLSRVNRARWKEGNIPLWNSLSGCGEPLAVSGVGAVTSPLRFWTAFFETGPLGWDFFLILRLVVAGSFAWFWAAGLGLGAAASSGVAAAFLLSGHMVLNLNQAFLDAEVWVPALGLGVLVLGGDKPRAGWVICAICGGAILLSGQPQSALVAAGFALALLGSIAIRSGRGWRIAGLGASAAVTALLLGSPVAFGIAEFLGRAHHMHASQGTAHEPLAGALSLVAPWLLGEFGGKWLGLNPFHFLPYIGITVVAAAFLGIRRALSHPAGPALCVVPVCLLSAAYGIPPLSWIVESPVLRDVWWAKYQGPAVLCAATLAGFGMEMVSESIRKRLRGHRRFHPLYGWIFPILVATELVWLMPADRPAPCDPLRVPAYVDFLRSRINPLEERVYGTGRVLMPHTGAALGIPDTRTYFALYPRRAYWYVRTFLTGPAADSNCAVFTGSASAFPALASPALDVLAARWIITTSKAGDLTEFLAPKAEPMWLKAGEKGRSGRILASGAGPLSLDLGVPESGAVLTGRFATGAGRFDLLIRVSSRNAPEGEMLVRGVEGGIRWMPLKMRLSPWAGRHVSVTIEARGTKGSWGFISDLLMRSSEDGRAEILAPDGRVRGGLGRLVLKYDREVLIYENTSVLPRARVMEGAALAGSPEEALAKVSRNISGRRFVFAEGESDWIGFVARARCMPARVLSDTGGTITCEVPGNTVRVLLLSDTWEKGWRACAGKQRLRVLPADCMFRAVAVPPGENLVKFFYEPLPFKLGLLGSGLAFGFLVCAALGGVSPGLLRRARGSALSRLSR